MSTTLIISLEELRIYGSQWLIQRSLNEMEGFNGYWYTDGIYSIVPLLRALEERGYCPVLGLMDGMGYS